MKKLLNLKNIAIALLIVIVVFQQCGGNKKTTGEIVKIDGKKYELIKHEIDTVEVVKTKVVTKKGEDIYHETIVEKEVIIPTIVDTAALLKDFFAKNIIEDSLKQTYDVATLMEVYEHIPPEISNDFLSGIHKLLNNEGILHLTVPHINVPVSAHHFRHFSVKSLVTELEPYFDIIEVMPFERISIKRKWLMKLFINKFFIDMDNFIGNYI